MEQSDSDVLTLFFYQGFDQFRSDETLCDVVLVSGEGSESFPVHRVLMASSSDYFKAMFTGPLLFNVVLMSSGLSL